ncbi:MAG: hypothetical protein N7Q72_07090, partial [Spiroplasma sp. Tabriz.8]|nr:hypothetical protein [Spiroplasma sp. Tabriz.8]
KKEVIFVERTNDRVLKAINWQILYIYIYIYIFRLHDIHLKKKRERERERERKLDMWTNQRFLYDIYPWKIL